MSPIRTTLLIVLATGAIVGARSSYHAYEQLKYYTEVEPDLSAAEIYEVELWFKLPVTLACVAVSIWLAAPMVRGRKD